MSTRMMSSPFLFAVAVGLTQGCATAQPSASGPTCEGAALSPDPLSGNWWTAGEGACPGGGSLKVTVQKKSTVRMCVLDGKQHGPFRAEDGDVLLAEGSYVWGRKHGQWRRYDGIKQQYVIETWQCDRVVKWEPEEPAVEPTPSAEEAN